MEDGQVECRVVSFDLARRWSEEVGFDEAQDLRCRVRLSCS